MCTIRAMERKTISTTKAPAAIGPYSQAVRAGGFLFCSGQIPLDPESGQLVGEGDIKAETRQVMENVGAVLEAAGSGWNKVVKANIYLTDIGNFATVNEIYGSYVGTEDPPARAAFQVAGLPKGAQVEVELVALA
jgi:2-iminobutanoate/2-iminopropanoate deaminase